VFQQFFLWPHFDVRRNIVFPATLRGKKIEKLDNICDALGIGDLLDRYPRQISVGQRQRVALARALVLGPRYLLLDEITSAQDVQHVALILDALHETARRGTGVLVVSHHFGFVRRLLSTSSECQVVFLENGAVVESGGIEHLESPHSDGLREYTTLARTLD
jgi:ABC-type methionine transport system ATPase subunit